MYIYGEISINKVKYFINVTRTKSHGTHFLNELNISVNEQLKQHKTSKHYQIERVFRLLKKIFPRFLSCFLQRFGRIINQNARFSQLHFPSLHPFLFRVWIGTVSTLRLIGCQKQSCRQPGGEIKRKMDTMTYAMLCRLMFPRSYNKPQVCRREKRARRSVLKGGL